MRVLPLLALLLPMVAGCASDPAPTPTDAGADVTASDVPASDVPATDVPATDVPATDVPATDVPATDVPATDVPASDVPATDVPATDVPATDVPATDAGCPRPDVVVLGERVNCGRGGTACPDGYTCMDFSGIVLQQFCGRACASDCDCPATQRCGSYTDKAGTHPLCVAM